jgi:hypothetical protein
MARRTTARITAFNPAQSPPLVSRPRRISPSSARSGGQVLRRAIRVNQVSSWLDL